MLAGINSPDAVVVAVVSEEQRSPYPTRTAEDSATLAEAGNPSSTPFQWINDYYGLNIKIGTKLRFCGRPGVVEEDRGNYLGVRLLEVAELLSLHPTWSIVYEPELS